MVVEIKLVAVYLRPVGFYQARYEVIEGDDYYGILEKARQAVPLGWYLSRLAMGSMTVWEEGRGWL